MYALNCLALATGEMDYNHLAIQLAKVTHPHFVKRLDGGRVCMVWKLSTDKKTVLVPSEGHLDAATGFVVYRLLQQTAGNQDRPSQVLQTEIADYRQLMSREGKLEASHDPLDLGMGLWMCHFFRDEEWAGELGRQSLAVARTLLDSERGVMAQRISRRLAFREFGTCMGLECYGVDEGLRGRVGAVVDFWRQHLAQSTDQDLRPITLVMYAAALIPGAFRDGYLDDR
jgi:hypothetical protein